MTWELDNATMTKQFRFESFVDAFAFMTKVALVAQGIDHHPDMTISWNTVTISTTSHDADNTVTDRDRRLAAAIDELA